MGVYDTRALPIYRYLHRPGHQRYAIADNFFQAAFGGWFLNHQWLIAASNPVWPGARNDGSADDLHSVVDANGDVDGPGWTNGPGPTCSDPDALATAVFPNCPPTSCSSSTTQPFNYYESLAPGTDARAAHLCDEQEFHQLARSSDKACNLKPVSFIKPVGAENEHPGYASVTAGSSHLIDLLEAVAVPARPLRPGPAERPRRRRARPVQRVPRQQAPAALANPVCGFR